jgi:hypothetical protein
LQTDDVLLAIKQLVLQLQTIHIGFHVI